MRENGELNTIPSLGFAAVRTKSRTARTVWGFGGILHSPGGFRKALRDTEPSALESPTQTKYAIERPEHGW